MIREQRLRTTGRHFERANKRETGERKKEKGVGVGEGKKARRGGPPPHPLPFSFFLSSVSPLFARSKWRPVVRCFRIIPPAKPPALQAIAVAPNDPLPTPTFLIPSPLARFHVVNRPDEVHFAVILPTVVQMSSTSYATDYSFHGQKLYDE